MGVILALAQKDLKLLIRDPMGLFFTCFFPLLMAVFFGTVFAGIGAERVKGIAVAVVDEDHTPDSRRFIASLGTGQTFAVTAMPDRPAAVDLVRRGKQTAIIVIPQGFGDMGINLIQGKPAKLIVGVDPARKAEAAMITGLLTARTFEHLQQMVMDPATGQKMAHDALQLARSSKDLPEEYRVVLEPFFQSLENMLADLPKATTQPTTREASRFRPIDIENLPVARTGASMNTYAVTFPLGIVWGMIGTAATFGISTVMERTQGTLNRMSVSPISRVQIILGKGLACFVSTVGVAGGLLVVAAVGFGVKPHSLPLLVAAVLSCGVAFVGMMMLLSVLGRSEKAAAGMGWAIMVVMAMLGGGMVPLVFMPSWMAQCSDVSPVKWAIISLEGPLWRGFSATEMLLPLAVLVTIGVAGMLLGARLLNRITKG